MRLIDADELLTAFPVDDEPTLTKSCVRMTIQHMPTVDAVPVVRCRDCEHKDRESGFCHGRGWPMQLVPDDGFCDKGKAR